MSNYNSATGVAMAEAQVEIQLNGEAARVPANLTISGLFAHLGIDSGRVAIEFNRAIVRKADWDATQVLEGSQVEIVHFVGGG